MRAVVLAVVLAATGRAFADGVPARLDELMTAHCKGCHDHSHVLDFTTLPGAGDHRQWATILDELSAQTMPPPSKKTVAGRFPLDPATRAEMARMITELAGDAADFHPGARFLSPAAWSKAAARVAAPTLTDKQLEPLIGDVAGATPSTTGRLRLMSAAMQLAIDRASAAVCQALADDRSAAARDAAITLLETSLFGEARPKQVARGAALYDRLLARLKDPKRTWTAVCTVYLSGPRLLYGSYLAGHDE